MKNQRLVQDTHCIPQLQDPPEIQGCQRCKNVQISSYCIKLWRLFAKTGKEEENVLTICTVEVTSLKKGVQGVHKK